MQSYKSHSFNFSVNYMCVVICVWLFICISINFNVLIEFYISFSYITFGMLLMGNQSKLDQGTQKQMNDYEKAKLLRVKENQERLRELGVTNIAKSLTSLVQTTK